SLDDGKDVEVAAASLTADDILIDRKPKDDRLIATDRGVTVLLDTTLTEELILEGLAREVVNRIQRMRKDANFKITDQIKVKIVADSDKLIRAVGEHKSYIEGEVLANGGLSMEVVEPAKPVKEAPGTTFENFEIDNFK